VLSSITHLEDEPDLECGIKVFSEKFSGHKVF